MVGLRQARHVRTRSTTLKTEFCVPQVAFFLDGSEFEDYINETGWWGKHGTSSGPKDSAQAASVADVTQADLGSSKCSMEVSRIHFIFMERETRPTYRRERHRVGGRHTVEFKVETGALHLRPVSTMTPCVPLVGLFYVLDARNVPVHLLGGSVRMAMMPKPSIPRACWSLPRLHRSPAARKAFSTQRTRSTDLESA